MTRAIPSRPRSPRRRGLDRRTLLRAGGLSLALPWLEAMAPARGRIETPLRLAWVYVPNGVEPSGWGFAEDGSARSSLEPLMELRSEWTLLHGLTADKARANGDGPGDHARSCAAFLTCTQPLKQDGAIHVGTSADQLAARAIGHRTRLRSLVVGGERARQSGQCDSGYSCAYSGNLSWSTPRTPETKETDPLLVFDRLTSDGLTGTPEERAERLRRRRSVLDLVRDEARSLEATLGAGDRQRVDEYLTALRELERRLEPAAARTEAHPARRPEATDDHVERMALHYELLALAFRTDATRLATYLVANEGSNRTHRQLELAEGHHSLSHHRADETKRAAVRRIDRFHVEAFAGFLRRLASIPEGPGTLLDRCLIVYGSGIRDGNRHDHHDLPLVLAGRGGGEVTPGGVLALPGETPVGELHLELLRRVGVDVPRLGDASRPLGKLSV